MSAAQAHSCPNTAMATTGVEEFEQRVLILAPIGRDARAAAQLLEDRAIGCVICASVNDLDEKLKEGAAAALITEEALLDDTNRRVISWIDQQPPWSDLPFIVLTSQHSSAAAHTYRLHLLQDLGNVSLLERPLGAVTLVSTVTAALRARRRQYEVRQHLLERREYGGSTGEPCASPDSTIAARQ
jgi:DNA-binding NtrC family response regulator